MKILIDKDKTAIEIMCELFMEIEDMSPTKAYEIAEMVMDALSVASIENCLSLKREFIRMASYIDCLLDCTDEQREVLMGFISRLAEYMPWVKYDE